MEVEKIEFREAAAILAKEAGIELQTNFMKERAEKWEDVYALYREATTWYYEALFLPENKKSLDYLLNRQISLETIKKFQLGCSHAPRDLLFFLKEKGFATQFIIDSGLFVSETRDKFFGRIIFPIANAMGHTVAFTGRVLGDGLPKYLNSPASHIFDKSSILYGLHLAKQTIAKSGDVFIVEGQMDTIALHQAGIDNAVGISGTALTKDHIRFLRRFAKTVYLSLDSDAAGVKATFASIENLVNEDLEIRIISIPNGKDPDEYIKNGGNYLSLRDTSLSAVEFYLEQGYREYDMNSITGKKKLIEKCLELVAKLRSQVEVDFYLQQVSAKLGVGMEALYSEYKKIKISVNRKAREEWISWNQKQNPPNPLRYNPPLEVRTRNLSQGGITEASNSFSPSLPDLIAGYIFRYQFLDLFFQEFRYTQEDLTSLEGTALLIRLMAGTLDPTDVEALNIIDLHLEEDHSNASPELIQRAFRDIIRNLHTRLLEIEKQKLLSGIHPDSSEYLEIYTKLSQKAKILGLPPGTLR
jgi:DNA primase